MSCIFCNTIEASTTKYPIVFFNNKTFEYIRCNKCVLVYLRNFPDEQDYLVMYPPSYQRNQVEKEIQVNPNEKLYGLRYSYGYQFDLIRKNVGQNATILDYGCGTGHFISNAMHFGFKCDGAEFNSDFVTILASALPQSNFYTLSDVLSDTFTKKYDVIRLSNVLEHLTNPIEIITRLKNLLKPNGILLLEGPIEDNFFMANQFRKMYFSFQKWKSPERKVIAPPYHIFLSNAQNQRIFFKDCGLTELHFSVSEDSWPFPSSIRKAKGIQQKIMAMVARISITMTRIVGRNWGNTFIYVGQTKDSH